MNSEILMSMSELTETLKFKGFEVEVDGTTVEVSLKNRKVSMTEVIVALDFWVTKKNLESTAKGILIRY